MGDVADTDSSGSESEAEETNIPGRRGNRQGAARVETTDIDWSDEFSPITIQPFDQQSGPILPAEWDPTIKTPLDYFSLFAKPCLIAQMVRHTNNYAKWKMAQRAAKEGLDEYVDSRWKEVDEAEMRAFLGIQIFMGISELPRYEMYWSKNPFLANEGVKLTMTQNRYEKLQEYYHVSDRGREPASRPDPLYKVRPVLDHISETFKELYHPHQHNSIDEAMIAYTGRLSYKQYLPAKPIKRGIEVWMRCDAVTAYLCKLDIYLGKKGRQASENGLGYDVVTHLSQSLQDKYYHLYFDNYFTSVKLMKDLHDKGLYACGTVRTNRKGYPKDLRKPGKLARGDYKIQQQVGGNLTATAWKDKKVVNMLSTLSAPQDIKTCCRRIGEEAIQVSQPHSVYIYNKYMNGVDRHDQLRLQYPMGRFSKKHWKYVVSFLLNCAVVNAFIVYKETSKRVHKRKIYTHVDFRVELAGQLIGGLSRRKRKAQPSFVGPVTPENQLAHVNEHMGITKGKRCKGHLMKGKRKETVYGCKVCGVHLCKECHAGFHSAQSSQPGSPLENRTDVGPDSESEADCSLPL